MAKQILNNGESGAVIRGKINNNSAESDAEVASLTSAIAAKQDAMGADDNYVTDAEKVVIGNTSGTNTGDQSDASIVSSVNSELGGTSWQASGGSMTDEQVKTAYENNADTNALTDAEKVVLGNTSGTNTGDQDIGNVTFDGDNVTIPGILTVDDISSPKTSGVPSLFTLYTADGTSVFGAGFVGPDTATANTVYKLPSTAPTAGQRMAFSIPVTTDIDGNSYEVVTISWVDSASAEDDAYDASWDGDTNAASKNVLYDKIETLSAGSAPTIQADDPTSASAVGFYGATTSGDFFYKSSAGLFNLSAGTYTADPTIPTLVSATIPTSGDTITLVFSESVSVGAGGNGGWTLNTPTDVMTYASGAPGTTLVFNLASTINDTDTPTITYTQPGNGIEATTGGGDLVSITAGAVVNNSTQSAGGTISYIASEQVNNNLASATVTTPTGTASGDMMIAVACIDVDEDITWGTGWTEIESISFPAIASARLSAAFNVLSASPEADYTFTKPSADGFAVGIITFRKSAGTWDTSWDSGVDYTVNDTVGTSISSTAITTVDGSMLFVGYGNDDPYTIDTAPATMTANITLSSSSTSRLGGYHEAYASGEADVVETAIWSASGDIAALALIIRTQ